MRLVSLRAKGYPCSQMMMIMALEEQGQTNPPLVRAMAGLANGLGTCSGSCGALGAGTCILALYGARGNDNEKEMPVFNTMTAELNEWFDERTKPHGSSLCHDITEGQAGSPQMSIRCGELIAQTYDKVMQILMDNGIDPEFSRDDD